MRTATVRLLHRRGLWTERRVQYTLRPFALEEVIDHIVFILDCFQNIAPLKLFHRNHCCLDHVCSSLHHALLSSKLGISHIHEVVSNGQYAGMKRRPRKISTVHNTVALGSAAHDVVVLPDEGVWKTVGLGYADLLVDNRPEYTT
jgi:hypothetical protein